VMPVRTYDIHAIRPLAPSEQAKTQTTLARRVLGGATLGGGAGAGLGAYLGRTPTGAAIGAGVGAGLGAVHGGLRAREQSLGDVVTQERMAMREALREAKKRKKAGVEIPLQEKTDMEIHPVTLRAMGEELMSLQKDAAEKTAILGAVGRGVIGVAGKAARGLAKAAPGTMGKAPGQLAGAIRQGRKAMGGRKFTKVVGGTALGAGALGTAGLAAAGRPKRPQPAGY